MSWELSSDIKELNLKFEKVKKAIIEQHNRVDPIQNELLQNREVFSCLEMKIEKIERHNLLILETLNEITEKERVKREKSLAFFLKKCYTKFVNLFK